MNQKDITRRVSAMVVCTALLAGTVPSPAAEASVGLGPMPKWTSSGQLKTQFGTYSMPELRALAEGGNPEAQHYLGWCYDEAEGVPRDAKAAAFWYTKAAEKGLPLAQNNLAVLYTKGEGVPKDLNEAVRWYRRAADQGLPLALKNLGALSASGKAAGLKAQEARLFYEQAAERGDPGAAVALGHSHLHPFPGASGDPESAVYWLTFAASKGCIEAYSNIGWLYMDGQIVPRDYDEARRWFAKGAGKGEPYCALGMALHELQVHQASPDVAAVRRWLLQAADKNLRQAFFHLGRLYELRDITPGPDMNPDYAEAAKWYQRAAEAGDRDAAKRLADLAAQGRASSDTDIIVRLQRASDLNNRQARLELAFRYWKGEAKPRNAEDAPMELMRSLVRAGDSEAMLRMAELHRTGTHVSKDPLRALVLLQGAGSRGNPEALERFMDLKEANSQKRAPAAINSGLEAVYPIYLEALHGQTGEPAARIARGYLSGASPRSDIQACAWFTLAAARGDKAAAAERDRLLAGFDEATRADAEQEARRLADESGRPLPSF